MRAKTRIATKVRYPSSKKCESATFHQDPETEPPKITGVSQVEICISTKKIISKRKIKAKKIKKK